MNAADVIGYVVEECTLICAGCLEDGESDDSPVFATSETDSPNHCERCGELIPESLTSDGAEYVRQEVWDGDGDPEVLALWAREFDYAFPRCHCCGEELSEVGKTPIEPEAGVFYCDISCLAEEEAEEANQ